MSEEYQLEQVLNFRDVGKTVNDFLGQKRVREGVFFRSARPDEATSGDKKILKDDLGIKTVIDLRTKTEHIKQAQRRKAQLATLKTNAAVAEPLHIEGIDYREIKLTGKPFERHILSLMSWRGFFKFLFFYVLGYRMSAVSVISREVMLPRGLVGMGLMTLDQSKEEVREALSVYTSTQSMPGLVHCTQGKDRTELVCALVLMILGIPLPAIEHDYFLTDAALVTEREERLAEIREIGLTEKWGSTDKDMITAIAKHLEDAYGGLDGYLDATGFGEAERAKVRDTLLY